MAAKLQAYGRGGQGAAVLSPLRARIARLALGDVDEAYRTLVALMRTARRETVRFDAAITVIELADNGGEGLSAGTERPSLVVVRGVTPEMLTEAIDARRKEEQ